MPLLFKPHPYLKIRNVDVSFYKTACYSATDFFMNIATRYIHYYACRFEGSVSIDCSSVSNGQWTFWPDIFLRLDISANI